MHLDIGCADGTVVADLALANPGWDCVGMEVRQPVVQMADRRLRAAGLSGRNAAVVRCNPQLTGSAVLRSMGEARGAGRFVASAAVQHPDPCFKRRHSRRRVLTPPLLATLAERMLPGAPLFLQTDVLDAMRSMLHACAHPSLAGRFTLAALATRAYAGGREEGVSAPGLEAVGGEEGAAALSDWFGGARTPRERAVMSSGGAGSFISRAVVVLGEADEGDGSAGAAEDGGGVLMVWDGTVPRVPMAPADAT